MRRIIKAILLAAYALWLAPSGRMAGAQDSPAQDQQAQDIDARISQVQGAVYLHLHDKPKGEFIAAEADSPLEPGDQVRTGEYGTADVSLGEDSLIELGPNSDFTVGSLDPRKTEFDLGLGHMIAKLRSLLSWQHMEFHTATAVASVRGTELAVAQEESGQPSHIGVFDEGHVAVRSPGDSQETMLGPGQETEVARGRAPAPPRALRALARYRRNMVVLRPRLQALRAHWSKRSPAQLRRMRQRLTMEPGIQARSLRNIRANRGPRNFSSPRNNPGRRERAIKKQGRVPRLRHR